MEKKPPPFFLRLLCCLSSPAAPLCALQGAMLCHHPFTCSVMPMSLKIPTLAWSGHPFPSLRSPGWLLILDKNPSWGNVVLPQSRLGFTGCGFGRLEQQLLCIGIEWVKAQLNTFHSEVLEKMKPAKRHPWVSGVLVAKQNSLKSKCELKICICL